MGSRPDTGARWPLCQGACGYVCSPTWFLIPLKSEKTVVDLMCSVYHNIK